jgi:hypothetical protein
MTRRWVIRTTQIATKLCNQVTAAPRVVSWLSPFF